MQANKNKILLRGRLDALPTPSHVNHGVEYFMLPLAVRRLSGRTRTGWSCPAPCASPPSSGPPPWAAPSAT